MDPAHNSLPRLIWTSEPDVIDHGEVTIETTLRPALTTILFREAAKRNQRPVDLLADIVETVLLMIDLPGDSACDEEAEDLMEKLWG